jgi:hypothetical protein
MDYFPFNAALRPFGLQDIILSVGVKPSDKISLALDAHQFMTAASVMSPSAEELNALGQEIDLTANLRYNKHFAVVLGGSVFLPGDVVKQVLGEQTAFWGYLMTMVNF